MEKLLKQIETAADQGLLELALHGALAVPDVLGALGSANGGAKPARYVRWFDENVASHYVLESGPSFDGETAYQFRCSLLHQHRMGHGKSRYKSVVFCEGAARMDNIVIRVPGNDEYLAINVEDFCHRIADAARAWLRAHATDSIVQKNLEATPRSREGFMSYIRGVTVVY